MSLSTGSLAVVDDIFSYQQYNKIAAHWRAAAAPADIQPGMIRSDSDNDKLYHAGAASALEEVLQLTRSFDVSPKFATLKLMDTNASHSLALKWNEDRSADQTLNIVTGAADRTVTLSGNPTLADWFDQAVKAASTPAFNGIAFPASQVANGGANVLDDYEEGLWTPTIYGSVTAGAPTYAAQRGYYTKIGNCVNFSCLVTISAKGGIDGNVRVGGLPFAAATVTSGSWVVFTENGTGVTLTGGATALECRIDTTNSYAALLQGGAIAAGFIAAASIADATTLVLTGHYQTA